MNSSAQGPFPHVHIVGCGLLGTSLGLALRQRGVEVTLSDLSPSALALAVDYDAGVVRTEATPLPELVVIATPPDVVATLVGDMLRMFPASTVIDVASVKQAIYRDISGDVSRFVGTHPMAGRERGGAVSGRSDLFTGRPWVICEGDAGLRAHITAFVLALGAIPIDMTAADHDEAVALVSHLPQVVSTLSAARLGHATPEALSLAGAGVRDVTRIAASDPGLWVQIVSANHSALLTHLRALRGDLDSVIEALQDISAKGAKAALAARFHEGWRGVETSGQTRSIKPTGVVAGGD